MNKKHNLLRTIGLGFGLALTLLLASGCKTNTSSGDGMRPMKGGEHQQMLNK